MPEIAITDGRWDSVDISKLRLLQVQAQSGLDGDEERSVPKQLADRTYA